MFELRVEGMKCGGCAGRVTKAVQSVDSRAKVDIDLQDKVVRVDTGSDMNIVMAAINAAGYPTTVVVLA